MDNATADKTVRFQSVSVRIYNQILGDHPFCSSGLPIALGWTFSEVDPIDIDTYEKYRKRRRDNLILTSHQRHEIVLQSLNRMVKRARQDYLERRTMDTEKVTLLETITQKVIKLEVKRSERSSYKRQKHSRRMMDEFFDGTSISAT